MSFPTSPHYSSYKHLASNRIDAFFGFVFQVWVQETKECPVVVDIMGIVLGVIGAIVAIGLALILMWKVSVNSEFISFSKV